MSRHVRRLPKQHQQHSTRSQWTPQPPAATPAYRPDSAAPPPVPQGFGPSKGTPSSSELASGAEAHRLELLECHAIIRDQQARIMELTQRVAELEMELTQQRLSLARQQDLEVTPQPPKAELSQPSPRWSPARRSTPPHRTQPPRVTPIAAAPTSLHQVDWAHEEDGYSTHSESQGEESEAVSSARLGQPAAAEAGGTSGGGLDAIRRKAQAALDGARQALQTLQGSTSRLPSTTSTSREPSRDVDAIGVVRSHSQDSSHLASAARPGFEDVAGTLDDDVGDPVEEIDSVFFYRIKAGIPVLKHGKWGRPHPRTLWLNTEERPPELVWQRGSGAPRAAAVDGGAISLGQVVRTTVGLTSKVLQRSGSVESSQCYLVIHTPARTLDLEFASEGERAWFQHGINNLIRVVTGHPHLSVEDVAADAAQRLHSGSRSSRTGASPATRPASDHRLSGDQSGARRGSVDGGVVDRSSSFTRGRMPRVSQRGRDRDTGRGRDWDRERDRDRDRDRERDRGREKDRGRERGKGRDQGRGKDSGRERDRSRRERSRDRRASGHERGAKSGNWSRRSGEFTHTNRRARASSPHRRLGSSFVPSPRRSASAQRWLRKLGLRRG